MRLDRPAALSGLRGWRVLRLLASAIAVALMITTHGNFAFAQVNAFDNSECAETNPEADTEGCLQQNGDNEGEADADNEGTGGDGVAGANVVGSAGTGNTNITANNDSRFSRSEGGDVNVENEITLENGPRENVNGGRTTVTSIATGISQITQTATPQVTITLDQVSAATGLSTISNTATALTLLDATNTATGTGIVSNTTTGASLVTGTGASLVSGTATGSGNVTQTLVANATGVGPVTQTINQSGTSVLNNLVAPIVTTTATNDATLIGAAPVVQTATAIANPVATAIAAPNVTQARLFQLGDNEAEADIDNEGVGGDAVAGANVIGVAGAGDTTVTADNNSRFASSEGGEANFENSILADNGPRLDVRGGRTDVTAISTGIATISQTAAPVVTLNVTQNATSSGQSAISNTATAVTDLSATNNVSGTGIVSNTFASGASLVTPTGSGVVTPTFTSTITATATGVGPVSQTINQTGSAAVTNTVTPVVNATATNNANITGVAPVSQTATAITNPQAFAQAGPNNTLATLVQLRGENELEMDIDNEGMGGDAVAGSNVIGVAGAGNTTINANNQSLFASSEGGDVNFENLETGNNGPRLDERGGRVTVTSIATGIATINQTATPTVLVDLTQNANADGTSDVSNLATGSATGTANQNAAGTAIVNSTATSPVSGTATATLSATGAGPLTQAITQNFSAPVNNTVSPTTSVLGTNTALIFTDASVTQDAQTETNPVSIAVAP